MKKYGCKKFIGIILLAVMILTSFKCLESYAQVIKPDYTQYVDNNMVTVNNYKDYIKLSPKEFGGVTGYIVYLNEEDDLNKSIGYLQKIAQNGYNVYVVKNNDYNDSKKVKVGKSIVKRNNENINWILNNNPKDREYTNELLGWMNKKEYRVGEISGYINSLKNLSNNKDIEEISNELHKIRNKI